MIAKVTPFFHDPTSWDDLPEKGDPQVGYGLDLLCVGSNEIFLGDLNNAD